MLFGRIWASFWFHFGITFGAKIVPETVGLQKGSNKWGKNNVEHDAENKGSHMKKIRPGSRQNDVRLKRVGRVGGGRKKQVLRPGGGLARRTRLAQGQCRRPPSFQELICFRIDVQTFGVMFDISGAVLTLTETY